MCYIKWQSQNIAIYHTEYQNEIEIQENIKPFFLLLLLFYLNRFQYF